MKRIALYLIVALVTFGIVLYLRNPDLFHDIYLWALGLVGSIVGYGSELISKIGKAFNPSKENAKTAEPVPVMELAGHDLPTLAPSASNVTASNNTTENISATTNTPISSPTAAPTATVEKVAELEQQINRIQNKENTFEGVTWHMIRYSDDQQTTLGLLYRQNQFFCYTLEDSASEDRTASGDYGLVLDTTSNRFYKRYKNKNFFKGFFEGHLTLSTPEGETTDPKVYIHVGGKEKDINQGILVSSAVDDKDKKVVLTDSKNTYKRLYQSIQDDLNGQVDLRLRIYNETEIFTYLYQ